MASLDMFLFLEQVDVNSIRMSRVFYATEVCSYFSFYRTLADDFG